ncbi:adenosine deaminase 2-like [Nasonia vitripennis]|uniref:Adenosine deaminase n=1 Tax=Nasonia vitripennis TaxID=7425 RepID=A0A7M7G3K0_NASVI|nr:adenosine deaminase 2-like [Nasonia vitripennis]
MFGFKILMFSLMFFNEQVLSIENSYAYYLTQREKLITEEQLVSFGANITLNEEEQRANDILMKYKHEELKTAFRDPKSFLPSKSFLRVSESISRSKVFRFIRQMPKGGVLHAHLSAVNSRNFILGNITRRPNLYVCRKLDLSLKLKFLDESSLQRTKECNWELLAEARVRDKTIDEEIAEALSMFADNPYGCGKGIDEAWKKFLSIFKFIKSLVTYRPVYEDFLYHIMEELYEDNVQFIEVRTPFSALYELNGYQYTHLQVLQIYQKIVDRFVKDYPDFAGVKWIYSPQRNVPLSTFMEYVNTFRALKDVQPDHVVGFDLVGQEDKGRPLKDFAKELLALGKETSFFFHAGETNWNGMQTDENLIDAVLLNTKRIGHGYALAKHPKLMQLVKEKKIAIEVSPISNQVLKLVKDLRNHPASYFFALDLPVVVSNDDPGFWGARALSYDFYEAFVGIMSSRADLRALKQLALNSIVYSSMNDTEKKSVMEIWEKRWASFISKIVRNF